MGFWDIIPAMFGVSKQDYNTLQSERDTLKAQQDLLYNPDAFAKSEDVSNPLMLQKYTQNGGDVSYKNIKPPTTILTTKTQNGGRIPLNPFPIPNLYQLVRNVDAVRIPIDVIVREVHRNGFHVEPDLG